MTTHTQALTRLEAIPQAGSLGARVKGIDLAAPLSDYTLAELRQLFLAHLVLVFPGQGHLTPAQHVAFAERWGELQRTDAKGVEGQSELVKLATGGPKKPADPDMPETQKLARADIWHSDQSFEATPPVGSFLLARMLPPRGGDTMFANQYLAYETLSAPIRAMLDGLRAVHSGDGFFRAIGRDPAGAPVNIHPVVRTHPETGRRALFVNRIWTRRIDGLSDAESSMLLDFLYDHAAQPEFTFRHKWTEGDLLMWDNRCTLHYAINDYGNETRVMHRATVLGDKPYFL